MLQCFYPMVKIVTLYSGFGGSTISLIELCEAFNRWGVYCLIYGKQEWLFQQTHLARPIHEFQIGSNDRVIQHIIELPNRPSCKRIILSCHEKSQFDLRHVNTQGYDCVRFVSEDQKKWHTREGIIIPNLIEGIDLVSDSPHHIAGVVGSISPRKQTHRAICQAIADGFDEVWIFGPSDPDSPYFKSYIRPLLKLPQVVNKGMERNRNKIYQSVSRVYHFGEDESACRVYGECKKAGISFCGNMPEYTMWSESEIKEAWFDLLKL